MLKLLGAILGLQFLLLSDGACSHTNIRANRNSLCRVNSASI